MTEQIRVLCVDDEIYVLKALKRLFIDFDYEIITASSGEEGLDVLTKIPRVHVVLSDYRMPGMNGVDFLQEVRGRHPDTICIILSGHAESDRIAAAINKGQIYKFMLKPWDDDELKLLIKDAVNLSFTLSSMGKSQIQPSY